MSGLRMTVIDTYNTNVMAQLAFKCLIFIVVSYKHRKLDFYWSQLTACFQLVTFC